MLNRAFYETLRNLTARMLPLDLQAIRELAPVEITLERTCELNIMTNHMVPLHV